MNCCRVQNYDVIKFCADIEIQIKKAEPVYNNIVFLGDLNACNTKFWSNNVTNTEELALHTVTNYVKVWDYIYNKPMLRFIWKYAS